MNRLTALAWVGCLAALIALVVFLAEPTRIVLLSFDVTNESADDLAFLTTTLAQYNATATFFVTGEYAQQHPDLVRGLARDYEVACSGMTRARLPEINDTQLAWELSACKHILENLTGQPVAGFRAQYGLLDERAAALLSRLGYAYDASATENYAWFTPTPTVPELAVSSLGPFPHALLVTLGDLGYFLMRQDSDHQVSLSFEPWSIRAHRGAFQYLVSGYADDHVTFLEHRDAFPDTAERVRPITPDLYEHPEQLLVTAQGQ